MTVEIKQVEGADDQVEDKNVQPPTDVENNQEDQTKNDQPQDEGITSVGDVNDENKTIAVDMYGIQVDLPVDKAKELIKKRDNRSKMFNEINDKLKEYETKVSEAERRARALEAAKSGEVAEAEAIFNEKLNNKVSKYHSKIVKGELKAALASHPEFIGGEVVTNDAISLILSQNEFSLDDNDEITSSGKAVSEIVSDFIKNREAFRKVSRGNNSHARPSAINPPKQKKSLGDGLKSFLDKQ